MKGKMPKILIGLVVSALSICLFFSFGFLYDCQITKEGGSINANLSDDIQDHNAGTGTEPTGPAGENNTAGTNETENGSNNNEEDPEDPDGMDADDPGELDSIKYCHIITNSNNGGSFDDEGNHFGVEGDTFTYSFTPLAGYYLEYLRVGNTKYYPTEDLSGFESTFKNNLTMHAHFKKLKEPTTEGTQINSGNNGKDNKKSKKPKKNE
jgi:hypothetical protein